MKVEGFSPGCRSLAQLPLPYQVRPHWAAGVRIMETYLLWPFKEPKELWEKELKWPVSAFECCHCQMNQQISRQTNLGYSPIHHYHTEAALNKWKFCSPETCWRDHFFLWLNILIGYWALCLPTPTSKCGDGPVVAPRGSSHSPPKEHTATLLLSWARIIGSKLSQPGPPWPTHRPSTEWVSPTRSLIL